MSTDSIQSAQTSSSITIAVVKKQMDIQKQAGDAAVKLIEQAGQSFEQRLSAANRGTSGQGLDVYA